MCIDVCLHVCLFAGVRPLETGVTIVSSRVLGIDPGSSGGKASAYNC